MGPFYKAFYFNPRRVNVQGRVSFRCTAERFCSCIRHPLHVTTGAPLQPFRLRFYVVSGKSRCSLRFPSIVDLMRILQLGDHDLGIRLSLHVCCQGLARAEGGAGGCSQTWLWVWPFQWVTLVTFTLLTVSFLLRDTRIIIVNSQGMLQHTCPIRDTSRLSPPFRKMLGFWG